MVASVPVWNVSLQNLRVTEVFPTPDLPKKTILKLVLAADWPPVVEYGLITLDSSKDEYFERDNIPRERSGSRLRGEEEGRHPTFI